MLPTEHLLLYRIEQPISSVGSSRMVQYRHALVHFRFSRTTKITNHQSPITNHKSRITNRKNGRTYQSKPSSSPSPFVAQLPLTLHSLPFSPPARPSLSLISPALSAPLTSCLLANTSTGTFFNTSSDNLVKSAAREVGSREWSDASMT